MAVRRAAKARHSPGLARKKGAGDAKGDSIDVLLRRARRAAFAGDAKVAMPLYVEAISKGCTSPTAFNDLGTLLAGAGQVPAAVVQFEIALTLDPSASEVRKNLCGALRAMGAAAAQARQHTHAVAAYTRLADIDVESATSQTTAGMILYEARSPVRALPYLLRAVQLSPDSAVAHLNLGCVLLELNQREAEASFVRAIELDASCRDAYLNLAAVSNRLGQIQRAVSLVQRALELAPDHAHAHASLAGLLREGGELEASMECSRRAISLRADSPRIFSNYLLARQADPSADATELLAEHMDWAARFAGPVDPGAVGGYYAAGIDRAPGRRLRVGYVSADFRTHSVAAFIEPVIAAHDRGQVHVTCYSDAAPDQVTLRIQTVAHPDTWRDVRALNDEALAHLIVDDQIDILVDLAGHTADNRLLAFARRPAPIQITYCGYPGTTGLSSMDWRFTDQIADPDGPSDREHTEGLWRLPHGFLCFQPSGDFDVPAAAPCLTRGFVTFGSFNNLAKVGDGVLKGWAQILAAVPGSRLLLKSRALSDREPRERLLGVFAQSGVPSERIEFAPYAANSAAHVAMYSQVDVGLDPFPYNGTTTTCEALWMGVPVVTLAGDRHAGRVGASLLTRIGCPELVASTLDAYIEAAVQLATDTSRLKNYRANLRALMVSSPLTRSDVITRDIEAAYREMWHRWCQSGTRPPG